MERLAHVCIDSTGRSRRRGVRAFAAHAGRRRPAEPVQRPEREITNLGEMFFSSSSTSAAPLVPEKSTFDFGLGRDFEIGFNLLDVNMYQQSDDSGRR
ncbi:MAG: hypothetical protein U0791_26345 [Gemmataceae bacterium]